MTSFLRYTSVLGTFALGMAYGAAGEIPESALKSIYAKACGASPFIQDLHQKGQRRFKQEEADLLKLQAAIKTAIEAYDEDSEAIPGLVKAKLLSWKTAHTQFEAWLEAHKAKLSFPLKFFKNGLHLDNAWRLLTEDAADIINPDAQPTWKFLDAFVEGPAQDGYAFAAPDVNIANNKDNPYGTGRGGAQKMFGFALYAALTKLDRLEDVVHAVYGSGWLKNTATFVHPTPLPSVDKSPIHDNLFLDTHGRVLAVNNGYVFGGEREEDHSVDPLTGDWWRFPQDCSTFVANGVGCSVKFSTSHQAFAGNNFHFSHEDFGNYNNAPTVIKLWGEGKGTYADLYRKTLATDLYLQPTVAMYDSFLPSNVDTSKVPVGVVWSQRIHSTDKFDTWSEGTLFGLGGHTGFVLGFYGQGPDQRAIIMATHRDVENVLTQNGGVDGVFFVQDVAPASGSQESPAKDGTFRHRSVYYGVPRS